jgi:hypothetical protein
MSSSPNQSSLLDRIIDLATKANLALNVIAPGAGSVGTAGLGLIKFVAERVNESRAAAGEPPIVLPPTAELINRMEATAKRIQDRGEAWLLAGETNDTGD